jgi:hypothetical protein
MGRGRLEWLRHHVSGVNTEINPGRQGLGQSWLHSLLPSSYPKRLMTSKFAEVDTIAADQFERDHLRAGQPLIVRGVAASWPSAKWTMAGLRHDFGDRELEVQIFDDPATRHADWRRETRTLANYLDLMPSASGLSQYLMFVTLGKYFPELVKDVELPAFFSPFTRGVTAEAYGIFLGPPGQGSELHYHPILWQGASQSFAVAIIGKKRFQFFPPDETDNLYPFPIWEGFPRKGHWSQVSEASEKFPRFSNAQPIDVVLEPGDGIYIPPHWWHSTCCLEDSLSLTLFFRGHWRYRCSPRLIPRDLTIHGVKSLLRWEKNFARRRQRQSQ